MSTKVRLCQRLTLSVALMIIVYLCGFSNLIGAKINTLKRHFSCVQGRSLVLRKKCGAEINKE